MMPTGAAVGSAGPRPGGGCRAPVDGRLAGAHVVGPSQVRVDRGRVPALAADVATGMSVVHRHPSQEEPP